MTGAGGFRRRKELAEEMYTIGEVRSISRVSGGYGSHVYHVQTASGAYILRDIENNGMNHPENEAMIVETLRGDGIPSPEILPTKDGQFLVFEGDHVYQLRRYTEGIVLKPNTAPAWFLHESAVLLGRIQCSLEKLPPLPVGIGQGYFDYFTPERAEAAHALTMEHAIRFNHTEISNALKDKITMMRSLEPARINVSGLTCRNTHGDYKIQQIVCGENRIHAVIDLTGACRHPVCFEVIRSYVLAAPECTAGYIDIDNFKKYIADYLRYGTLSTGDLGVMPYLFFYQNVVADYFGQYYAMAASEANSANGSGQRLLLRDTFFSVKLCRWLERHMSELEQALRAGG